MITRVLVWLGVGLITLFIFLWLVSGGWQKIKVAFPHYYNPVEYFFRGVQSGGLYVTLPGTPSQISTFDMNNPTGMHASSTMDQPPAVDVYIHRNEIPATDTEYDYTTTSTDPHSPAY